ncbi:NADPH:quinone reductase [Aestuariirhabdus litorea]|uniref:NADPH:quinone reductase n=1 Tax=Aestuariirhabdus litorea TaxID=2528527 RepID=A0A3P3VRG8_9GAMM|nr:NADPH:quinone reductase [Aestuariirhabdus litorea]RRJ85044.1 NADPH:quinone reductase [Aestuariirhabdus litorea]RWW98269.1 NADPH:quinone reductase [Endozoicomonadaceae bacterium GTF-13]
MKAIQAHEHGGIDVLKLEEVADLQPAEGQVLVSVKAAGVNPVDTYIRAGTNNYTAQFPHCPGKDAAGVVAALGKGVTRFKVGDRVYCAGNLTGSSAEQALCLEGQVQPLPDNISFEQGACIGTPYTTAWRALFIRAHALAGETVLVHGASGGVGLAAVQLARAAGLRVIGTASTDVGRDLVLANGAHHALDHSDPDHLQEVIALTGGTGVNLILEMLANVNLGHDLPALAKGGRVVIIGSRGPVEINPRDTMARDASILGMAMFNATPDEMKQIHAALVAGLENDTLSPVVNKCFPLAQMGLAHEAVLEPGACGNIVVKLD